METLTNYPPVSADPLSDRLAETYASLAERTEELTAATARVPETLDDATLRTATDFVARQLKPHLRTLDETRVAEKEPFLTGGRVVDRHFASQIEQLNDAIATVEHAISVHLRAKESDLARARTAHGSIATLRTTVGFEVLDRSVAISALAHLIDDTALEKAIRGRIRELGENLKRDIEANGSEVEFGVRYFAKTVALVR